MTSDAEKAESRRSHKAAFDSYGDESRARPRPPAFVSPLPPAGVAEVEDVPRGR